MKFHLSGRDVRRAAYSGSRIVDIEVTSQINGTIRFASLPALIDGTINLVDSGARRRMTLTFETQTPDESFEELLDEDNARWLVWLGNDEPIQQGVFYLNDVSIDDTGVNRNYRLSFVDESRLIGERRSTVPVTYEGDVITVCEQILAASGRTIIFTGTRSMDVDIMAFIDEDKDPWAMVVSILAGYGYEIYMNHLGECVIEALPIGLARTGAQDLTTLKLSQQRVYSRRGVNHIIVVSTGEDNKLYRADVYDDNPRSRTYYKGPYGDVPLKETIQGLNSQEACFEAAQRIAVQEFGRKQSNTFACLQIPRFEIHDTFIMNGFLYSADQISYSLITARPMYLTGRTDAVAVT